MYAFLFTVSGYSFVFVLKSWLVKVPVQLQSVNSEQVKSGAAVAMYDVHSITEIRDK